MEDVVLHEKRSNGADIERRGGNLNGGQDPLFTKATAKPITSIWPLIDPVDWLDCWADLDGHHRMVLTRRRELLWTCRRTRDVLRAETELRIRKKLVETADTGHARSFASFVAGRDNIRTMCLPRAGGDGLVVLRSSRLAQPHGVPIIGVSFHFTGSDYAFEWADFATCYKLTAAEHKTTLKLLNGFSAAEIAKEGGVSICTVRTHINHVYEKTGVSCREELWRELAPYRLV